MKWFSGSSSAAAAPASQEPRLIKIEKLDSSSLSGEAAAAAAAAVQPTSGAFTECELRSGAVINVGESTLRYEEVDAEDAVLPSTGGYSKVMRGRALGATTQISGPDRTKLLLSLGQKVPEPVVCTDPLHQAAAEQGWSFCPKCGQPPQ